ncbi:MAG: hypothetical protein RL134_2589 [Actinomycetota bacterium]|jgi:hypothetical protein
MSAMRRPIFWFLWPAADPGPLDDKAVQIRWVRVCGRGPWRWGFLIGFTALAVITVSAAVAATLADPGLLTLMFSIVIALPLIALLARAWVAGTYVSDRGIKVSGVLTTVVIPWPQVRAIDSSSGSRILGLPLRAHGQRVEVSWAEAVTATHVETASPDLWLRPEAFDAARDRLLTWLRETR